MEKHAILGKNPFSVCSRWDYPKNQWKQGKLKPDYEQYGVNDWLG